MPGIFAALLFTQACSSIAYIQLNDRLPAKANALEGRKVFLAVEDERKTKEFAGRGVKREFDNFSETLSYSVRKGTEPPLKLGLYDAPSLVKEALRLRIENEGVEIVPEKKATQVELVFMLQEFSLDLIDRTWKVRLGYEARLVKNGAVLSKQFATGEAERLKIIGTEQADAVVGDLFADVMNRINLVKLFRDAGQ
ncbi:MAG: hypothetical protein NTY44_10375 [Deltaproteobacteria bacterium]|nr:hypothetical protein [Deltaproteobacteria bacterium]